MTSEGLGDMFEGDSTDRCTGKISAHVDGGRAEGLACTDPGARTPIGVSGNLDCCGPFSSSLPKRVKKVNVSHKLSGLFTFLKKYMDYMGNLTQNPKVSKYLM